MDVVADDNNNTSAEKSYSLRPRTALKKDEEETDQDDAWKPRGRVKKRSKQKCLPLSKYRRKTANARERSRMREINEAFEALRRALPHFNSRIDNQSEKTTKIMTLRLAMKYISALDSALRQADGDSDGESLISDYSANSRENSLTPTSLSEQSDIFDQLFTNSSFEDYSPSATFSSSLPSLLSDTMRSPPRTSIPLTPSFEAPLPFSKPSINPQPNEIGRVLPNRSTNTTIPVTPKLPNPSVYNPLESAFFRQTDCQSSTIEGTKGSLSPVDVQDYTTTWREFECLPSSPINLDDLFIT